MGSVPSCLTSNHVQMVQVNPTYTNVASLQHHDEANVFGLYQQNPLISTVTTSLSDEHELGVETKNMHCDFINFQQQDDTSNEIWSSSTTPQDCHDSIVNNSNDMLNNAVLLTYIGWEVFIDGLGVGRVVRCICSNNTISFLIQLRDGRKYIVPVSLSLALKGSGVPELQLIQRVK